MPTTKPFPRIGRKTDGKLRRKSAGRKAMIVASINGNPMTSPSLSWNSLIDSKATIKPAAICDERI